MSNPNIQHDGKFVIDQKTGALRLGIDGHLTHHKVQEPEDKLCNCPRCYNYFSVLCVEKGNKCVPLDPEVDGFCRKDSYSYESIIFPKPQLYKPEEVKLYYPNWETINGWDQSTPLWLAFQGDWEMQWVYDYDPVTGQETYYQIEQWTGPPTGKDVQKINYHINIPTPDFYDNGDSVLLLMTDILDCPDYLLEFDPQQPRCGNYTNEPVWDTRTTCTSTCRCSFTKAQYLQWMKNNHREYPYYYIPARPLWMWPCNAPNKSQNGWCYGPVELRPRGLFTQCQTWDSNFRCNEPHLIEEQLYKCCEVPPSLVGWYTLFYGTWMTGPSWFPQQSNGISVGITQNCSSNPQGSFAIQLLWDNNEVSNISGANATAINVPQNFIAEKPEIQLEWNSPVTNGHIDKCCNRFYWKLQLTVSDEALWHRWPGDDNANDRTDCGHNWWGRETDGFGWMALPKSATVNFWMSLPVTQNSKGQYPSASEAVFEKIIEKEFPLKLNYDPGGICYVIPNDDGTTHCLRRTPSSWECTCSSCGPFFCTCGTGATSIAQFSGTYGDCCMISTSEKPGDTENRTTSDCKYVIPEHRYHCYGYPCNPARNPRCFYKDCLYGFLHSEGPSVVSTSTLLMAPLGAPWTEEQQKAFRAPAIHGGYCKFSKVNDETKICGTCNSPYINCIHPESAWSEIGQGFQPRLCGQGKCILFEPKDQ